MSLTCKIKISTVLKIPTSVSLSLKMDTDQLSYMMEQPTEMNLILVCLSYTLDC